MEDCPHSSFFSYLQQRVHLRERLLLRQALSDL